VHCARPQPVLGRITEAAVFLVLTVERDGEDNVRNVLTDVSALKRSVGFRIPDGELTCVVGIGSSCWDRLYGEPRPAGLRPLPILAGRRHAAVSTPGDLLFHLRAHRFDLCFELAQRLVDRLGGDVGSSTRFTGSVTSTSATCSASSTGPRTPKVLTRLRPY
jgi:putative iron-dependent peroxidase